MIWQFVVLLVGLLLISFLLKFIWSGILSGRALQLVVFPGVLIHELSHAIGCILTGARIDEISLFSSKGSYVKHGKPKIPLLGILVVSLAPIAGGILFLWLLSKQYFGVFTIEPIPAIRELVIAIVENRSEWKFWVLLYLIISVVISISPSKKDLSNSAIALAVTTIVLLLILHFELFSLEILFSSLSRALAVGVFFGLSALLISLPIWLLKKLI